MSSDGDGTPTAADAVAEGDWEGFTEAIRRVPLHALMGLTVLEGGRERTVVTMDLSDGVRGPTEGTVHAGILATLADTASAFALRPYVASTEMPVTTDLHLRYYRQPHGGPLTAVANVVHRGHRLLGTECSITDAQQRVLARSTATYMVVPMPAGATWGPSEPT
jgi:uncharacterized protein (TIGR00369 family)